MTIRQATKEDSDALVRLETSVFKPHDGLLSKRAIQYHIKRNYCVVVEHHHILVGYALVLTSFRCPRIYSLAVSPLHVNQGIGTLLMHHLIHHFPTNLRLEVRQDNAKAIALYLKHGFHISKEKKGYYGDGGDAWELKRTGDS